MFKVKLVFVHMPDFPNLLCILSWHCRLDNNAVANFDLAQLVMCLTTVALMR